MGNMGKIGANSMNIQQLKPNKPATNKPAKDVASAQQQMQQSMESLNQANVKEDLSKFVDKNTAESINKAQMDPKSLNFGGLDKEQIKNKLRESMDSLQKLPDDMGDKLNKLKQDACKCICKCLDNDKPPKKDLDALRQQLQELSSDSPKLESLRQRVNDALNDMQELNQPLKPKPPAHMQHLQGHINADGTTNVKYASVFAK